MVRRPPAEDPAQDAPRVTPPHTWVAGLGALTSVSGEVLEKLGPVRAARTMLRVNQKSGFDCPGCAWPDGDHRHVFEFCENGVKAIAEEATPNRADAEFFAQHPVAELAAASDYWLGQQGRLVEPMLLDAGATHYRPVSWDVAFDIIAEEIAAMSSPDEAVFYTSGRTSNEAAFLWQLFARVLGTNNLPDCSNMCHESSGAALQETIGIGKGSVLLEDIHSASLIVVCGQNPGTNHPRMLSALEEAKERGAVIVSVNPLPEAGLAGFKNPQRMGSYLGKGSKIADRNLQIRLGGDLALFQALGRLLLEAEEAAPGTVLDRAFIEACTSGFEEYAAHVRHVDLREVELATGLTEEEIRWLADHFVRSSSTVLCWAMGITQHRDAVATIREFVNVMLLQGNIGKAGAGLCPVRGHSNVQGDRTMGIWERMPDPWLDRLGAEFDFAPPRHPGFDTVEAIQAMRAGRVRVFLGMGGNWVRATPDSDVTEVALRSCALTVQVSTKLNRSHAVTGRRALILPTLGRTDRDLTGGHSQVVTVEDSMGVVHTSQGRLAPASQHLRSEVDIVATMAERCVGSDHVPWSELASDYARIRDRISRVVVGHEDYDARVRRPGGFVLPHPPRDRRAFDTTDGKAHFTCNPLRSLEVPEGRLILQTIRSHDQFNTTIYGLSDRYRGIHGGRRVVLVNPDDLAALGVAADSFVDIVSEWHDGERRARHFRVVSYPTARGCAAAYFPETNVLVPLDSTAEVSNTPTSKAVIVRLDAETGSGA